MKAKSKIATMLAMIQRPEGASLDEISRALGWEKSTVRGAITNQLRDKRKLAISGLTEGHRGRVYRIAQNSGG